MTGVLMSTRNSGESFTGFNGFDHSHQTTPLAQCPPPPKKKERMSSTPQTLDLLGEPVRVERRVAHLPSEKRNGGWTGYLNVTSSSRDSSNLAACNNNNNDVRPERRTLGFVITRREVEPIIHHPSSITPTVSSF